MIQLTDDSKRIKLAKLSAEPDEDVNEEAIRAQTPKLAEELGELQGRLYAQQKYSMLVILQGMDAAGKDGAVRNVFSGVNPAGCRVTSFKVPTELERSHDFLWRIHQHCPERGMIQVFNRSHYEDILVPSVHALLPGEVLNQRYGLICSFEQLLLHSGTLVYKFFLHVSPEEQLKRINERKTNPYKRWKYQESDITETRLRPRYEEVYEDIFKKCSGPVPWHIIPADKKWYRNYLILRTLLADLKRYDIHYPEVKL